MYNSVSDIPAFLCCVTSETLIRQANELTIHEDSSVSFLIIAERHDLSSMHSYLLLFVLQLL